jgi:transposase-like protein
MMKATKEVSAARRSEHWRERISEQEGSGISVHRFCEEQGLTEQSFYSWRKRLRQQQPTRFALVETGSSALQGMESFWSWSRPRANGSALAPV